MMPTTATNTFVMHMRVAAVTLAFASASAIGAACGGAASSARSEASAPSASPIALPIASVAAAPTPATATATAPDDGGASAPALAAAQPAEPAARSDDPARIENAPRHRAAILDGAVASSKLAPGAYACRIDAGYKLRPCTVRKDEKGFTWIDMPGSLLGLTAVVRDDAGALVLDGTSADPRPFGCFACQERCSIAPSSCACQELMPAASRECLLQPLTARLTKSGASWRGTMRHVEYFNHYEGNGQERHITGWDTRPSTFVVEIAPASGVVVPPRPPASGVRGPDL